MIYILVSAEHKEVLTPRRLLASGTAIIGDTAKMDDSSTREALVNKYKHDGNNP